MHSQPVTNVERPRTIEQDEEQFRRTMMGFDGEHEAALKGPGGIAAAAAKEDVDAMEVDSSIGAFVR